MKRSTPWRALLGALTLIAAGAACSKQQAPGTNVLRLGNGGEPRDLDPHVVTGTPEVNILQALFEGLVAYPPSYPGEPAPGVAHSWSMSADGAVWRFALRPDARWSNGDPVTAHDFVYSWRRVVEPALGCEYADWMYIVAGAEDYNRGLTTDPESIGLRAVDDHTFEVRLVAPTADFLRIILHHTFLPVHPPTIERFGGAGRRMSGWTRPPHLVGNGPFQLSVWQPNNYIEVLRNPHYWDAATVRLDGMRFHPISDENTEERAFRSGQLHITGSVPAGMVGAYRTQRPAELRSDPLAAVYFYRINATRPVLDDVRVRRALSLAIDRELLVRNITRGGERVAYAVVPEETGGYNPPRDLVRFDPEAARQLLAEAGFPAGRGFPSFELLYNTSDNHRRLAEAVQQMWRRELGINVTLTNKEWMVYLDATQNLNYDISRGGWVGNDFPFPFLRIYLADAPNNQTGFASPRYDALIAEARHTIDDARRFTLLREAESLLLEFGAVIPVYWYTNTYLIHPSVRNWISHPVDQRPYKYVELATD
jgi:oligopeptide transport system substrate-binding protein